MNKQFADEFKEPGSEFRGAPFWAWNGKLDPLELRRQIQVMHKMGLGGFFMHSRVGLDTPYLSDEWFDCVKACIDEAEKLDMLAYLYDEDRWPSGAAGGFVTSNPEYRRRIMVMEEITEPKDFKITPDTLGIFKVDEKDDAIISGYEKVDGKQIPEKLSAKQKLVHFYVAAEQCSSWYNNQTYLDTLNDEAVKKFIEVTHEAYYREVGNKFGKSVPMIFTDEPHYSPGWGLGKKHVAWTGRLTKVFKERYGYDIIGKLPEIFYNISGHKYSQVRYHFVDCLTHLFVDAFSRQIGEWCGKHGIQHTGHLLSEDVLSTQTGAVGSCMRFYEYMQAPGMDLLTEHWRIYDVAKQVSSAAHQFGWKWRLTETYGCTGWDFPFEGHKALGDWQAALGINLRCQHLSWYTMLGQAKRDYPASIFYQSPWWEQYSKVEDYFGRINAVMTKGEEVRDLLMIHPIESMWLLTGQSFRNNPATGKYDTMFMQIRDKLLSAHLDYDLGDEELLARHGKVDKSGRLVMAKAKYKAVVVPPLLTMRKSTVELLRKFRDAGGLVVFSGEAPDYVDALPSDEAKKLAGDCVKTLFASDKTIKALESAIRKVSITDKNGEEIPPVLYLLREDDGNLYLFICNSGHEKSELKLLKDDQLMIRDRNVDFPEVLVILPGFSTPGKPLELDPEDGSTYTADAKQLKSGLKISTSLAPCGSRLFVIPKKRNESKYPRRQKTAKTVKSRKLGTEKWNYRLSEDNVIALDFAKYSFDGGKIQRSDEILRVDQKLREHIGVAPRGGRMVQPWAREKNPNPKRAQLELQYEFEVKEIPSGGLFLALERPETFEVFVNAHKLSNTAECGWWVDLSLRKLPVDPEFLHKGKNLITMKCDYSEEHSGLEIIYLLGNFGAELKNNSPVMTKLPGKLKTGDWVKQKLPFYSGAVSYLANFNAELRKGEKLILDIPEYRGVIVRIFVNGEDAGSIAWRPNTIDLTKFVKSGKNEISIQVISHRRNSHGPFHYFEKWPSWTGHEQFAGKDDTWFDGYQFIPCGLMKNPILEIRK